MNNNDLFDSSPLDPNCPEALTARGIHDQIAEARNDRCIESVNSLSAQLNRHWTATGWSYTTLGSAGYFTYYKHLDEPGETLLAEEQHINNPNALLARSLARAQENAHQAAVALAATPCPFKHEELNPICSDTQRTEARKLHEGLDAARVEHRENTGWFYSVLQRVWIRRQEFRDAQR